MKELWKELNLIQKILLIVLAVGAIEAHIVFVYLIFCGILPIRIIGIVFYTGLIACDTILIDTIIN